MTFKEKLAQEHPEKLDNGCSGGCIGCPYDYGYADTDICSKNDTCEICWNSEMPNTPALMTAEEAWDIAKKLFADFSETELDEIFGKGWSYPKLMELSPYEAKAKIEEWERNQIQVGDVVKIKEQTNEFVVTTMNGYGTQGVNSEGNVYAVAKDRLVKTGKHIDIQSVLEQIGGDKDD